MRIVLLFARIFASNVYMYKFIREYQKKFYKLTLLKYFLNALQLTIFLVLLIVIFFIFVLNVFFPRAFLRKHRSIRCDEIKKKI